MQKIKSGGVKGIQIHNNREKESRTNLDIDKERSKENYDLIYSDNYNRSIKATVKVFATETKTVRKDAVMCCSFIVTSDEQTMNAMDGETQKQFFKDSLSFFAKRYGAEYIPYATVHMDERTPHMHIGIVPIHNDRLSAKNLFDRQELTAIQTDFSQEVGQRYNLERGKEGSERTHLSEQRFKLEMTKQKNEELELKGKELAKSIQQVVAIGQKSKDDMVILSTDKKALEGQINALQDDFKMLTEVKANVGQIEDIKGKKVLLGSDVTINAKEFERLKDLAKKSMVMENKVNDLEAKNRSLQEAVNQYKQQHSVKNSMEYYQKEAEKERKLKEFDKYKEYISKTGQEAQFKDFSKGLNQSQNKNRSR